MMLVDFQYLQGSFISAELMHSFSFF